MNSGDTVHLYRFRVHTIGSIPHLVLTGRRPGRNCTLLQHSPHLSRLGYIYRRSSLQLVIVLRKDLFVRAVIVGALAHLLRLVAS